MTKAMLKGAAFRQGRQIGERWLSESRAREDLGHKPPTLYQAYVSDANSTSKAKLRYVSEFFESSWAKDRELGEAREALLRLYAIAVKAHFFLFRLDCFADEPQVFWVPDLMRSQTDRFGLYCPFLKSQKALVVAEADLGMVSSGKLGLGRFPVVLTNDSESWFDERHWEELSREGDLLRLLSDNQSELKAARAHQDSASFPYGELFDAPEPLRAHLRQAGMRWAEGVGKMYLPKGFDLAPVQAYYEHLMAQYHSASQLSALARGERG